MTSTLLAIRQHARRKPDGVALDGPAGRIGYRQLLSKAERLANTFARRRLRVIALIADNSAEWIVTDLAAQIAGSTLVPLPGFFSVMQIMHALESSGADALMFDAAHRGFLHGLPLPNAPTTPLSDGLYVVELAATDGTVRLPAGTAKISFTSGTTADAKGVCLPQAAMDTVASSLCTATNELNLRRHLALLPLATLLENVAGIYAPLINGSQVMLPSLRQIGWQGAAALDTRRLMDCIRVCAPNSLILVPQMLALIVAALEQGQRLPDTLRFIAVGGGHVSAAVLARAESLELPVFEGYGLTEAASVVALNTPAARRVGSVGKPLPHVRLGISASGEICVSGASMCGYIGDAPRLADEMIRTGDVGSIDDDGYLYVDGRRKDVFITSFGRNVSPEWVEAQFQQAASIEQIAVFGEARPWNVAVVVPRPTSTRAELQADIAAVNKTLPDYAAVGGWVLAAEAFTGRNGLLTANGRKRRTSIAAKYGALIQASYDRSLSKLA